MAQKIKKARVWKRPFDILVWFLSFTFIFGWPYIPFGPNLLAPPPAEATGEKMILLWDSTNDPIPAGWESDGTYDGYFLRGDAIALKRGRGI